MDDIRRLQCRKQVGEKLDPAGPECFVDGHTTGTGEGPVPCLFKSVSGNMAKVVVADGHDTGVEISVPLASVTMLNEKGMRDIAKGLFRKEAR